MMLIFGLPEKCNFTLEVKVKLSLWLVNQAPLHEGVRGSGGTDSLICNFGSGWR
jgi:hypothetical protein